MAETPFWRMEAERHTRESEPSAAVSASPGGDCLCGRGAAAGTLTWTSSRMHFRAFHDGPASWHHENSADWACLDCVADTATAIASGQVRENMRRIARERRPSPPEPAPAHLMPHPSRKKRHRWMSPGLRTARCATSPR